MILQSSRTLRLFRGVGLTATVLLGLSAQAGAQSNINTLYTVEQQQLVNALDNACAPVFGPNQQQLPQSTGCQQYSNAVSLLDGGSLAPDLVAKIAQDVLPNQIPTLAISTFLLQDQLTALRGRLLAVHRGGARGVSINMPLYNGDSMHDAGNGSAGDDSPFSDTPWGFFLSGRYQDGDVHAKGTQNGFDFDTKRVTGGVDYRVSDKLVLGGSLAYGKTNNDVKNDRGDSNIKNVTLWFYGSYFPKDNVYVDWSLGYGHNKYDGSRRIDIDFSGFGGTPFSSTTDFGTDGKQYNVSASSGYEWSLGAWQFASYARMDYIQAEIDAYRERGGDGFGLAVEKQDPSSLESLIGGRVNHAFSFANGVIVPGIDVALVHQWKDQKRRIAVTLADAPDAGTFGITAQRYDQTYMNLTANLTTTFTGGQSGYVSYQTFAGRSDIKQHVIEVGYRLEF